MSTRKSNDQFQNFSVSNKILRNIIKLKIECSLYFNNF